MKLLHKALLHTDISILESDPRYVDWKVSDHPDYNIYYGTNDCIVCSLNLLKTIKNDREIFSDVSIKFWDFCTY